MVEQGALTRERAQEALAAQRATWTGWRWLVRGAVVYAVVMGGIRVLNGQLADAAAVVAGIAAMTLVGVGVGYLATRKQVSSLRTGQDVTSATVREVLVAAGQGQVVVELPDGTRAAWASTPDVAWLSAGQQVWCTPIENGALVRVVGVDGDGDTRVIEPAAGAALQWDPSWREHLRR